MTTPLLVRTHLDDDQAAALNAMLGTIQRKRRRNELRKSYYEGKRRVQNLGIAVSPEFEALETAVGWAGTVVDRLAERRSIDHIIVPGSTELTARVNEIWTRNEMDLECEMLDKDKSIHGLTFEVIASSADGPVVLPTPATKMTCEYKRAERRVTMAASDDGVIVKGDRPQATYYAPDANYVVERDGRGWKILKKLANPSGIVPVVRFVNKPLLDKPWGASNISPAVMSYVDTAVRTLLGMEVAREFFAAPKMVALNLDEAAFVDAQTGRQKTTWETYMGRIMAVTGALDEDGNASPLKPEIFQLPASSPAAFIEVMKMLSQLMAAETGYPASMWGFVTENPPSGDGQKMFEATLVRKAKHDNRIDSVWHNNSMRLALLAAGVPKAQLPDVQFVWDDPATPQPGAETDAISKQVAAKQIPERSTVALEKIGYDRSQVERVQAEWKAQDAKSLMQNLAAAATGARQNGQVATLADANRPPVAAQAPTPTAA